MNFKALAIATGLVFAAGSSFADIDMNTSTTNDIATIAAMTDAYTTGADLGNAFTVTSAVIIQEGVNGVAFIEQADAGAGLNFAAIYQQASAVGTVAYISQGAGAANSRAVINQK